MVEKIIRRVRQYKVIPANIDEYDCVTAARIRESACHYILVYDVRNSPMPQDNSARAVAFKTIIHDSVIRAIVQQVLSER